MSGIGVHFSIVVACYGTRSPSSCCVLPPLVNAHQSRAFNKQSIIFPIQVFQARVGQPRIDASSRAYLRAQDDAGVDVGSDMQIEGLSRDYCSEFVCTSSPLVEQTVKALARDLLRQTTWTFSLFTPGVAYQDPFRSFRGVEKYKRLKYSADCIPNAQVSVSKLRMVDDATAEAAWSLTGTLGAVPLSITFTSTFKLDLITGRVLEQRDRWDLSQCTPQARLAFLVSRAWWSLRQAVQDAKGESESILQKFSIDEPDQQTYYKDPTDPTRFFHQEDNTLQDAILFAAVLGVFYILVNAWRQLAELR
eukprot:jgi/Botrbrau1/10558/Bobra.0343s0007.1